MAILAAAGVALGAPRGALAQTAPQPRQDAAPGDESQTLYGHITPEEYTARVLTRIATLDLRFISKVGPRDFRIAAALFGLAEELTPQDEGIVRRRCEAALSAGDTESALRLTRRLAMLDQDDEVAILRLVSAKVGELQTAGERLALYAKLLGPAGEELPAAIRSRLALDSALLLRERGDIDGFADRLALAVKLDSTHKEAATLAAQYYSDQSADPSGNLQLLVGLLYADPLDPNVYESLAKLLARNGAWAQAKRFHDNGITLLSGPQGQLTDQLYIERQYLVWRTEGPRPVVDALNVLLEAFRKQTVQKASADYSKAAQEAHSKGQPPPPTPQIDLSKVTLPLPYERLRLLAAAAADDPATLEQASANLELLLNRSADQAKTSAPDEMSGLRAEAMALLDLQSTRLWTNIQVDKVREFARTKAMPAPTNPQEALAQVFVGAMLKVRTGDPQGAIALAGQLPDSAYLKDVVLALAYEQSGAPDQAADHLKNLAGEPFSLAGAWAISRLKYLNVPESGVYPHAAQLSALAAGISKGLDRMITDPRAYMSLSVEPVAMHPGPIGQIGYRVTLKNTSPIPLSVGGDRVINTRLLFAPRMEADLDKVLSSAVPEVIEVDRRLRLEPGESFSAIVHPEYGWAGYSLEAAISRSTTVRWRVLQGFGMAQGGGYQPGSTSLTAETPSVVRPALPETRLPVGALCAKLHDDGETALPVTVAAIRSLLTGPQRPDRTALLSDAEIGQLAAAAAERYPRLSPLGRKMFLVGIPPSGMIPGAQNGFPLRSFDESCRTEQDPEVMEIFLATRVSDAKDPTLAAAAMSSDPGLGELARLLAERLATTTYTYARIPPPNRPQGAPSGAQGGQDNQGGQAQNNSAPGQPR